MITQWQNTEFIYTEILNKTSLALMFTSDIFLKYIFHQFQVWTQICAVQKASVDVNISYY